MKVGDPIRVFIVSKSQIFTLGIASLLQDLAIVSSVKRVTSATGLVGTGLGEFQVVVIDVETLGSAAPRLCRRIREERPKARIIALGDGGDSIVPAIMVRAGVDTYLNQACNPNDFVDAIRTVQRGEWNLPLTSHVPVKMGRSAGYGEHR